MCHDVTCARIVISSMPATIQPGMCVLRERIQRNLFQALYDAFSFVDKHSAST